MTKLVFLLFFLTLAGPVYAQRGLEFLGISDNTAPGEIFEKTFFFGLSLVGLAALVMLVFGGLMYLTAGDSTDQTKRARGYMGNAVFGLVLALLSWLILFTINPNIVQVLELNLNPIKIRSEFNSSLPLTKEEKDRVKLDVAGTREILGTYKFDEFSPTEEQKKEFKEFFESCRQATNKDPKRTMERLGSTVAIYTCVR